MGALRRWARAGWAMAFLAASPAFADGSVDDGRALAQRWCASCHPVDPEGAGNGVARPFQIIAHAHQYDTAWLQSWLSDPHPRIKGIVLSRQQIDDVTAYLRTISAE